MSSKVEENTFQPYDDFINKLIQYLASTKKSSFLDVLNKPYFYQNEAVSIQAKYYDANFTFDPNAKLWIKIVNKKTKKSVKYPFAIQNNNYKVSISNLDAGYYTFTVFDEAKKNKFIGNFSILNYNLEEQFINSNKKDLQKLAQNSNGTLIYPNKVPNFIEKLIKSVNYKAIQKSTIKITPLIDRIWLLGLIVVFLSTEWFIRKYKGYI